MLLFLGIGPPFVNPGDCPPGQHLGFTLGGGIVTVVSVHPARRRTSPPGFVLLGSGDGVGDCHDAADLSRERLFYFPLVTFLGAKICALFLRVWCCFVGYCWVCL